MNWLWSPRVWLTGDVRRTQKDVILLCQSASADYTRRSETPALLSTDVWKPKSWWEPAFSSRWSVAGSKSKFYRYALYRGWWQQEDLLTHLFGFRTPLPLVNWQTLWQYSTLSATASVTWRMVLRVYPISMPQNWFNWCSRNGKQMQICILTESQSEHNSEWQTVL